MKKAEKHVFESKGRARRPAQSAVAKALGQVSALRSINGTQPATRCTTFFMLKASGAEGRVVDPEGEAAGVEVKFGEWEMMTNAYAFFLDGENSDPPDVRAGINEQRDALPLGCIANHGCAGRLAIGAIETFPLDHADDADISDIEDAVNFARRAIAKYRGDAPSPGPQA